MCIAYIRFQPAENAPLFIAANRDEFHARPTAFASVWDDSPNIIAGRDLEAGGTWLGINRQGGAALITNIRDPFISQNKSKSRGSLVHNALLLQSQQHLQKTAVQAFLEEQGPLDEYNGFNLIFGNSEKLYYVNNYETLKQTNNQNHAHRDDELIELNAGSYTLSNADLFTVWPKTKELGLSLDSVDLNTISSADLQNFNSSTTQDFSEDIFKKLANNAQAPEHLLPRTGVSDDLERLLSSPFIISPEYGTRCSSIILNFKDGSTFMAERSFDQEGQTTHQVFFYRHDDVVLSSIQKG